MRLSTSALVIFGFVGSGYSESELPNADGMRTDGSPSDCASRAALLIVVSLELGEFAIAAVSDATMEFAELETGADEVEEACAVQQRRGNGTISCWLRLSKVVFYGVHGGGTAKHEIYLRLFYVIREVRGGGGF